MTPQFWRILSATFKICPQQVWQRYYIFQGDKFWQSCCSAGRGKTGNNFPSCLVNRVKWYSSERERLVPVNIDLEENGMNRLSLSTWLSVSCSHSSAVFSPAGGSEGAGSFLSGYRWGQRVEANTQIVLLLHRWDLDTFSLTVQQLNY